MTDPSRLPHPIKITIRPDGTARVRRISWRTYDRLNPMVAYRHGKDGRLETVRVRHNSSGDIVGPQNPGKPRQL